MQTCLFHAIAGEHVSFPFYGWNRIRLLNYRYRATDSQPGPKCEKEENGFYGETTGARALAFNVRRLCCVGPFSSPQCWAILRVRNDDDHHQRSLLMGIDFDSKNTIYYYLQYLCVFAAAAAHDEPRPVT